MVNILQIESFNYIMFVKDVCMKIINSSRINFLAGKVHLYSDFDGTYLPVSQSKINCGIKTDKMKNYSDKMNKFFRNTDKDLDFHITTQRSFKSFMNCLKILKDKEIYLPIPNSVITEGGYMEFIKTNDNFYANGQIPYNQNIPSTRPPGEVENKSYNPRLLIEKAWKENDIIITAGNEKNDKELVNPLKYVDLNEFEQKASNKDFFQKRTSEKLKDLKLLYEGKNPELKKELESIGLLQKIQELPIYGIIVKKKNKPMTETLRLIYDAFSPIEKVIVTERGNLDEAIKKIIKTHSNKSEKFKQGMSEKTKEFIFGKTKTDSKWIPYCIAAIILLDCVLFWGAKRKANKQK